MNSKFASIGIVIVGFVAAGIYWNHRVDQQAKAAEQQRQVDEAKTQVAVENDAMQALRKMHDEAAKGIATKIDVSFSQGEALRDQAVADLGGADWQIISRDYAQHKAERDAELQQLKQQPVTPESLGRQIEIMRTERKELASLWYPGLKEDAARQQEEQNLIVGHHAWVSKSVVAEYQERFSEYVASAPNLPDQDKRDFKVKFQRICSGELGKVRQKCRLPTTEQVVVDAVNACNQDVFRQMKAIETEAKDKNNAYVEAYNQEAIRRNNEAILRTLFNAAAQQR